MKSCLFHFLLTLLSIIFFLSGCAQQQTNIVTSNENPAADERVDSSCSYFYFLWGNNAEYNERYEEALEAYEKASICDPGADYIAEKIPILLIQLGRFAEATSWLENYIRRRPEKTVQRFMLARLKIQEKKEDEAIVLYEEALVIEPDNNNIRLRLGLLYGKKREFDTAEKIFLDILKNDPDSYFSMLYLARLNAKTGKLDAAENYYIKTLALNWSDDLSFEIAEFYNLRKQFDKAQEIYTDILSKDKKNERAALGLVQTYLFLQDGESALQELLIIRNYTNAPERIDLVRSQILINIGEITRAKRILTTLLKENQFSQANYLLGVIYYEEMDFDNAITILRKIPTDAPEYRESILMQVRILEERFESDLSIKLLEKALSSENSRLPIFYSYLSSIQQKHGNEEKALSTLANGIQIYPESETLLYDYAILQEKNMNHEKAMAAMRTLLSLNPNNADALNFIGYSWADRNIYLNEAHEYIRKALDLEPNSGYIRDSLGWVFFRMGEFDKAKVELEKAIQLEPEDPYIYEHLGDTHKELGNKEESLRYYQKSIELISDKIKLESIRKKINTLNEQ